MPSRDYILRLIEQMAAVLRRVRQLLLRGQYDEALTEVRTAALSIGVDLGNVLDLTDDALLALVARGEPRLDPERAATIGRLLAVEGEIHEGRGDPRTSYYVRRQALRLLIEGWLAGDAATRRAAGEDIPPLLDALAPYALPDVTVRRLVEYHEMAGEFARAEDALFDLADQGDEGALDLGLAFYARLRSRSDDELERGNLPRAEIEEGEAELRERTSAR